MQFAIVLLIVSVTVEPSGTDAVYVAEPPR